MRNLGIGIVVIFFVLAALSSSAFGSPKEMHMPQKALTASTTSAHLSNEVLNLYFGEKASDNWSYQWKPGNWGESCYYEHFAVYTKGSGIVESEDFQIDSPFSNPGGGSGTITAVLSTGDIQIERKISLASGNTPQFIMRYTLKNTSSNPIQDVRFFQTIDFDIPRTEYPMYTDDHAEYNQQTGDIWVVDYEYFRDMISSTPRESRHGMDYYYIELWNDWDDGNLNGRSLFGPGDPAIGKQFNLGTLSAGQEETITITVKYNTEEAPDLTIKGVEYNQAIQEYGLENPNTADNSSISLVANKAMVVRAYIDIGPTTVPSIGGVTGELHILQEGQELEISPLTAPLTEGAAISSPLMPAPDQISAPKNPSRQETLHSLNFYLEEGLSSGTYDFYVTVDPNNDIYESNDENNRYPESGYQSQELYEREGIKIIYYQIRQEGNWPSNSRVTNAITFLRKTYPIDNIEYESQGHLAQNYGGDIDFDPWTTIALISLWERLKLYNFMNPLSRADVVVGWLPESAIDANQQGKIWLGITNYKLGSALVYDHENYYPSTLAHETGHNYGLNLPPEPEEYKDPNATPIGEGGFSPKEKSTIESDRWNFMNNESTSNTWVDKETYEHLYSELAPGWLSLSTKRLSNQESQEYLIISGTIDREDNVELRPFHHVTGQMETTSFTGGNYALEIQDSNHNVLASYSFEPDFTILDYGETDLAPLNFVVPYPSGTKYIVIKHSETASGEAAQEAPAQDTVLGSVTISENAPTITVTSPNGGESISGTYNITWTASDPDGDVLSYSVAYSPNGLDWNVIASGLTDTSFNWDSSGVPGGSNGYIKVIATDGVNTAEDQSDNSFTITTKGPAASIISPEEQTTVRLGEFVTFEGMASDLEDGALSGSQLHWSSDIDGDLGTGTSLSTSNLSEGTHTITLNATDSDGKTGADSITLDVTQDTTPPASPTGLQAMGGATSISLTWDANTESDLAGYKLYLGESSGSYYFRKDLGKVTSYTITDLNPGTTYYIAITAYDEVGNESNYSDEVSATTYSAAMFRVTSEGNVHAHGAYYGADFLTGGADIAEHIKVSEPVEPGDVVALDPENPGEYRKSRKSYSTLASGIISTQPGFTLGIDKSQWGSQRVNLSPLFNPKLVLEDVSLTNLSESPANYTHAGLEMDLTLENITRKRTSPSQWSLSNLSLSGFRELLYQEKIEQTLTEKPLLALMGVVPVKAITENGPIKPGDLLTTSSISGHVMRCEDKKKCMGTIIGKALEPLEKGTGIIKMLVMR